MMLVAVRQWARRYTEEDRYSPVGVAFHWVMAVLVLIQIGWGFWADAVMPGGDKVAAYEVHMTVGLSILMLALLRAIWRVMIPGPVNDADRLGVQSRIAHATHILFYICFFGLPISGWVMWSSVGQPGPLRLAGFFPWPAVPLEMLDERSRFSVLHAAEAVHHYLVILLLLLIPAHVVAALKHHFWDRHDVLRGMLPEIPDWDDPQAGQRHIGKAPRLPQESGVG